MTLIEHRYFQQDPGKYIGSGIDSEVFRSGDKVVKIYKSHIPLGLAQTYQAVTNQAAEYIKKHPFSENIEINGIRMPFDVSINPILGVGLDGSERVVGVSNFVPGPQMIVLERKTDASSKYKATSQIREDVKSKEEQEFLINLMEIVYARGPVLDRYDDSFLLQRLSDILDSSLDTKGISLISENAKIGLNLQSRHLNLIVTDLCVDMGSLVQLC